MKRTISVIIFLLSFIIFCTVYKLTVMMDNNMSFYAKRYRIVYGKTIKIKNILEFDNDDFILQSDVGSFKINKHSKYIDLIYQEFIKHQDVSLWIVDYKLEIEEEFKILPSNDKMYEIKRIEIIHKPIKIKKYINEDEKFLSWNWFWRIFKREKW